MPHHHQPAFVDNPHPVHHGAIDSRPHITCFQIPFAEHRYMPRRIFRKICWVFFKRDCVPRDIQPCERSFVNALSMLFLLQNVHAKRRCVCTFARFGSNIYGSFTARFGSSLFCCGRNAATTHARGQHMAGSTHRLTQKESYCHRLNRRDADKCRRLNHLHVARRLIDECRTRPHLSWQGVHPFTVCEERWICKRTRKSRVGVLWAYTVGVATHGGGASIWASPLQERSRGSNLGGTGYMRAAGAIPVHRRSASGMQGEVEWDDRQQDCVKSPGGHQPHTPQHRHGGRSRGYATEWKPWQH